MPRLSPSSDDPLSKSALSSAALVPVLSHTAPAVDRTVLPLIGSVLRDLLDQCRCSSAFIIEMPQTQVKYISLLFYHHNQQRTQREDRPDCTQRDPMVMIARSETLV
jgi:hypothetical protein